MGNGKKMGINTKSVEAKQRKQEAKNAQNEVLQRQKEDELWKDDDKSVNRKLDREREKEAKAQMERQRKLERKAAYEEEMAELAKVSAKPTYVPKPSSTTNKKQMVNNKTIAAQQPKLTRFEIQNKLAEQIKEDQAEKVKKETILCHPIEPNLNYEDAGESATTIEEALQVLKIGAPEVDKHPEKRAKNAYLAYEHTHLPRLKEDNPNLRLSQLKQLIKKQWQKAPENPFNQLVIPTAED